MVRLEEAVRGMETMLRSIGSSRTVERWGGGWKRPVIHHNNIVKTVSKVTNVLPFHVTSDLTDKKFLDFWLEASDKVEA